MYEMIAEVSTESDGLHKNFGCYNFAHVLGYHTNLIAMLLLGFARVPFQQGLEDDTNNGSLHRGESSTRIPKKRRGGAPQKKQHIMAIVTVKKILEIITEASSKKEVDVATFAKFTIAGGRRDTMIYRKQHITCSLSFLIAEGKRSYDTNHDDNISRLRLETFVLFIFNSILSTCTLLFILCLILHAGIPFFPEKILKKLHFM
ncbi:hypothetical protein ACJX0J_030776 [Zea mays]